MSEEQERPGVGLILNRVRGLDLSQGAKLFFGHLTGWTGIEPEEWPPVAELADGMAVSPRQIHHYAAQLREAGLLRPVTKTAHGGYVAAPDRPGHVYLLASELGPHKIGRAKEVGERLKTLAIQLPFDVSLAHHFPADDCVAAEAYLHGRFAEKRLRGEWFRLTEEDVEWIMGIVRFEAGEPVR